MAIKIDFLLSARIHRLAHAGSNLLRGHWPVAGDKYHERPPVNRLLINSPRATIYLQLSITPPNIESPQYCNGDVRNSK